MLDVQEGMQIPLEQVNRDAALQAAVDYRGDVSFELEDGSRICGFAFSLDQQNIFYMDETSESRKHLQKSEITKLIFSGKDEARGKSWEDWQRKKSAKSDGLI